MRHKNPIVRLAACALVTMCACAKNDTQNASAKATPQPASSAPPVAPGTASATVSVESGVAIDPAWVASDPKLTTLLAAATPACLLKERFTTEPDGSVMHGYEVYAPAVDQAELEKRFRKAAQALGYTIRRRPLLGLGFDDEVRQRSASVLDARVFVVVKGSRDSARALVRKQRFESWSLIDALGVNWSSIGVERSAGDAGTFEAELPVVPAKLPIIEAWARERKLQRDGEGWLRKISKEASAIVINVAKGGELFLTESRGELTGAACRQHRLPESAPSAPVAVDPSADGDLLEDMLE